MRIVCQSCSATYAIDDRMIGSRGVKAQCPKCRHQQLVTKSAAGDDEVVFSAPKPPPPVIGGGPSAHAPAPKAGAARPSPPVPSATASNAGGIADLIDAALLGPAAPGPAASGAAARSTASGAEVRCRVCNKPLLDAFDVAVGVCDGCQTKSLESGTPRSPPAADPGASTRSAVPAASPAPVPITRFGPPTAGAAGTATGGTPASSARREPVGPVLSTGPDLDLSSPDAGAFELTPASAALEAAWASSQSLEQEPAPSPPSVPLGRMSAAPVERRSSTAAPVRPEAAPAPSAASGGAGPSRRRWVAGAIALALATAGGGLLWRLRAEQAREAAAPRPVPAAIAEVLPRWKLAFVDLDGTPAAALADAERLLAADLPASYGEAEEQFQRALLLDPSSDRAIAGYALALAFGRGPSMGDEVADEAQRLLEAARARTRGAPFVLAAEAHLALSRPTPPPLEDTRALAQRAVDAATTTKAPDRDRAFALLALGRTFIQSSSGLAIQSFNDALAAEPMLHRARLYRAMAEGNAGELTTAIATLQERLAQTPEQPEALAELAQLYQEVGEPGLARKVYEKVVSANPGSLRPVVALAVLHYQSDDRPNDAASVLRPLARNAGRYEPRELLDVHLHLAAVERRLGRLEAAMKAAHAALAIAPGDAAARLQSVLSSLDRQRPAEAEHHLSVLTGRLGDPALEKVLLGRVRLAQGRHADAQRAFNEAADLDRRRTDARLLAAVAAARGGDRDGAFRAMHLAAQADPTRASPERLPTRYYLQPSEALRGAEGALRGIATDDQDARARLYEGVLRLHQRDLPAAQRFFGEALKIEPDEPVANAFAALLALDRGQKQDAERRAKLAAARGRQVALAHYALGRVLAAQKKYETAARSLREALALEPSLLAAEVSLAEVEAATGARDVARDRLKRVIGIDPSCAAAKRALYRLDRTEAAR